MQSTLFNVFPAFLLQGRTAKMFWMGIGCRRMTGSNAKVVSLQMQPPDSDREVDRSPVQSTGSDVKVDGLPLRRICFDENQYLSLWKITTIPDLSKGKSAHQHFW
jgi:hypothetical protein